MYLLPFFFPFNTIMHGLDILFMLNTSSVLWYPLDLFLYSKLKGTLKYVAIILYSCFIFKKRNTMLALNLNLCLTVRKYRSGKEKRKSYVISLSKFSCFVSIFWCIFYDKIIYLIFRGIFFINFEDSWGIKANAKDHLSLHYHAELISTRSQWWRSIIVWY